MHLRRALLLFAIVLGLAAVAASVSRPRDEADPPPVRTAPEPTVAPGTAKDESSSGSEVELYYDAADPRAHRMNARQAATVFVAVPRAGQVEIADLGMGSTAEPLTPARFEVLTSQTGRFPITFVAAGGEDPADAGTLVVRE